MGVNITICDPIYSILHTPNGAVAPPESLDPKKAFPSKRGLVSGPRKKISPAPTSPQIAPQTPSRPPPPPLCVTPLPLLARPIHCEKLDF